MITKETSDFSKINFRTGETILIDKPSGISSFKVVEKIRRTAGAKAGHAGTLDPLATGLLIVCTGRLTKKISVISDLEKTYSGTIILGKSSPSFDLETEITIGKSAGEISEEQILSVKEEFTGEILQTPPMYSALKIDGKTLYRLARSGKSIYREPRKVVIHNFIIKKITLPEIEFEITCSKGTYIRAIANDFGERLGCGGILGSLRRLKIGDYSVDNSLTLEDFVNKVIIWKELSKTQENAATREEQQDVESSQRYHE
jgi:tRNA pseudouridine55 synthase